jgi:hypothetical protein
MGKLLLLIPLTLLLVCVALLAESWVKLYALSTVPVTALTMAQGFHILVMFMLIFLFLALELGLKKEGGGVWVIATLGGMFLERRS